MADETFCVRWNRHQPTLISVLESLLEKEILVDCTLAAEGQFLRAHRVVLSACSPYFKSLLSQHYARHPIIILKDVKFSELKYLMEYIYRGELNISFDQLGSFLNAAESLQIKGLVNDDINADNNPLSSPESLKSPEPVRNATSEAPPRKRKKLNGNPIDKTMGALNKSSTEVSTLPNSSSSANNLQVSTCKSCPIPVESCSESLDTKSSAKASSETNSSLYNLTMKIEQVHEKINKSNQIPSPLGSSSFVRKIKPLSEPVGLDALESDVSVTDLTLDNSDDDIKTCYSSRSPKPSATTAYRESEAKLEKGTSFQSFNEQKDAVGRAQTSSESLFVRGGKKFKCSPCGKSYPYKQSLVRHQRTKCFSDKGKMIN